MQRHKPNKNIRKNPDENKKEAEDKLKSKIKQKLREKQLERTPKFIRYNRMDDLQDKIEKCKNPFEMKKLKYELGVLEKIQEKELNLYSGDFPDYGEQVE